MACKFRAATRSKTDTEKKLRRIVCSEIQGGECEEEKRENMSNKWTTK